MYINYEIMTAKLLSLHDLGVLQLIKQNRIADLSKEIEFEVQGSQILERFSQMGYIESIKGSLKDSLYKRIRTSKLGNDVLESIEIPDVTEGDLKMAEYLFQMYLNHEDEDRVLGNKKAITKYISILRNYLGFSLHQFYYLCEYFLAEYPFTKKLENIFMDKNKIRYGDFKHNLSDSVLLQFYEQKQKEVEYYFTQKIKEQ